MFKKLAFLLLLPFSLWAAPAITVSGNSVTILGAAQTISLTCTLIDPNNTGNLRSGSSIITTFITSTATPSNVATCGPIYGNDVITDGYGNANTTYYKVQVFTVSGGIIASTPSLQQFYAFTGSGTIDLATATPLAPSFFTGPTGNVVMPGTLAVTGASTFNGGITTTTTNSTGAGTHSGTETFTGITSVTNAGVFTNTQENSYLTSNINGMNISSIISSLQGGGFTTDAFIGAIVVPVGSTVHQADGLTGLITNSATGTNAVGSYGASICLVNSTSCWGSNFLASDTAGKTGTVLYGDELDVNISNVSTTGFGLHINGSWTAQPTNTYGININAPLGGTFTWPKGLNFAVAATAAPGANNAAIYFNPVASTANNVSQGIEFDAKDPVSGDNLASLNLTAGGDLLLQNSKSGTGLQLPLIKVSSTAGGIQNAAGTAIMGLTLKKGSGAGNYTNATTSYTVADSTNLCYTVTIPTGWKLGVSMSGNLGTATAAVVANYALTDNAACSTANAGILVEGTVTGTGATVLEPISLNWVITGDGAAHNIALQFKTSNGADSATLQNSSATLVPTMKFELMPSN